MRAWVVGSDFGGEAEVGGEASSSGGNRGGMARYNIVKVDSRRGGVVER